MTAATQTTTKTTFGNNGHRLEPQPLQNADPDTLTTQSADDSGNAQCLHYLYGSQFRYCLVYGWLHYNGKYWDRAGAEALVKQAAVDTLLRRRTQAVKHDREAIVRASRASAHNVRACLYLFASLVEVGVSEFDKSPDLLNCQNGVVDLRTGKLTPHNPKQFFTYAVPIDYDPTADMRQWCKFLLDVTGNKQEIVDYLQLGVGYSLTGHTWEEILFYIEGPTRSGKGTFTETLLDMMGRAPLASEVDFVTFTATRDHDTQNFDLAPLKPCRFIVASESNKYQRLNAAKIKQATGGNSIYCAFKRRDHFSYRPQFKIWLCSNEPANADPDDDAVWCRLRVIKFPNSYAGREDKRLKARLRELDNLRGVLRWAIEGARKWAALEAKGLQTPAEVQEATQEARDGVDILGQWLDECVIRTDDDIDQVTNDVLYSRYTTWCKNNGHKPKSHTGLTRALKTKGYKAGEAFKVDIMKDRKKVGEKTVRGALGIQLVKPDPYEEAMK